MSWLSQIGTDIANVWNEQPNWAKGLEIGGVGALATGGLAAGLGLFDAAGAGAAGAGIDAFPTIGPGVAAADAAGSGSALGFAGDVGGAAATDPSLFATTGLAGDVSGGAALPSTGGAGLSTAGAGLPGGATGVSDLSGGASDLGGWLSPGATDFGSTLGGAAPGGAAGGAGAVPDTWAFPASAAPGGTTPSSGILSTLGSAAKNVAPVAGVAGLGYNLYSGYQTKQQINALANQEQQASALVAQNAATANAAAAPELSAGETLQSYLQTGTLPTNIQAQVDQQVAGAKAGIIQGYASRGMSTDPNQNSALAQDLANVDTQAQSLKGTLETNMATAGSQMVTTANNLLQTGVNATNISSQIPIAMQNLSIQLAQATSTAIASFAAALNSGGTGGGQKFQLTPA